MELNPDDAFDKIRGEIQAIPQSFDTYVRLVNVAKAQRPSVERLMIFGLRRYLGDNGMLVLPKIRIQRRPGAIVQASMTWEQGITISSCASRPYSVIFRLMLHCGWGAGEFLRFNTAETWKQVKVYLDDKNGPPYFRYDFAGRKSNVKEWYSMIPRFVLQEFVQAVEVPVRARSQEHKEGHEAGILLDTSRYRDARVYLESAWRTAVRRSTVNLPSGNGRPVRLSLHELRDTYRTRAQQQRVEEAAVEFSMGHQIDAYGYNKVYTDFAWMWNELSKIYGPAAASESELNSVKTRLDGLIAGLGRVGIDIGSGNAVGENAINMGRFMQNLADQGVLDLDAIKRRALKPSQTSRKPSTNIPPAATTPKNLVPATSPPPTAPPVKKKPAKKH